MSREQIEVGDHVYLGEPGPNKVHWEVMHIDRDRDYATVKSPMSSRRHGEMLSRLTIHTKGTKA